MSLSVQSEKLFELYRELDRQHVLEAEEAAAAIAAVLQVA